MLKKEDLLQTKLDNIFPIWLAINTLRLWFDQNEMSTDLLWSGVHNKS